MSDASIARASAQWWARAANVLKALAATSGIVTFLAFGWQIHKELRNARTEIVQAWQESEIFGVVFECRERGATMGIVEAELRRRLLAADDPLDIPAGSVTGPSVRRALMQLTERKIIALRPDVTYVVPLEWTATTAADTLPPASNPRFYGCHCYHATPEDAEIMPDHCRKLFPVAQSATKKSGT